MAEMPLVKMYKGEDLLILYTIPELYNFQVPCPQKIDEKSTQLQVVLWF
jgi:hypothetical protein